ncbi:MAG: hypothetical protein JRH07_17015 [Deltaproteobacteria bacterium]|nr:hypothetical protein [Deltaproteobacteria bacterium]
MINITEFKRLNFFTGFFTTADDWTQGQNYHMEKRMLHNRGLHTPGIFRGERDDLRVEAAGGFNIRVLPGAALDGAGREIYLGQPGTLTIHPDAYSLPQPVYVAIRYEESETDRVENVQAPQYSGYTRVAEIPRLEITTSQPDNRLRLELARIVLQPGAPGIANPVDPDNPGGNEIDRRYVVWAGSVGTAERPLPPAVMEEVVQLMGRKRRDFAALARAFPVPSAEDVRHGALVLEMLARTGSIHPENLPAVLAALAAVEQDVGQEMGTAHPGVVATPEYQAYEAAVSLLITSLREGAEIGLLLTREDAVAEAAREISEIVIQPPVAEAGADRTALTPGDTARIALDASGSHAFGGHEITRYEWELAETHGEAPIAHAGRDRVVFTGGEGMVVTLDAGGSRAFGGRQIVRYHWKRKED